MFRNKLFHPQNVGGLGSGDHLWISHYQRAWVPCINISAVKIVLFRAACGPVLKLNVMVNSWMSCLVCWSTTWVLSGGVFLGGVGFLFLGFFWSETRAKCDYFLLWGKAPVYIRIILDMPCGRKIVSLEIAFVCWQYLFAYYKFYI